MYQNKSTVSWFAAKVFYNRTLPVKRALDEAKIEYYCPEKVVQSLIFIKTDTLSARLLEQRFFSKMWFYRTMDGAGLARIADREMELFMFVTSSGEKGLTYLGDDKPEYHTGDRVRVIDGPFKGAEGYIKRIKKDRRLVVSVAGVADVATSFIHPDFLEIIS